MKKEHEIILGAIRDYLTTYPEIRFGQALFNLNINQFANQMYPGKQDYNLRDIYCDEDKNIVKRLNTNT